MMPSLTGHTLAVLCVALALLLPLAASVLAARHRQQRRLVGGLTQWLTILLAQVAAVAAVLVLVNDQYGLYASWNDLLGVAPGASTQAAITTSDTAAATASWTGGAPAGFTGSLASRTFHSTVAVRGSRTPLSLYVVVPPQYTDPAYAKRRFPVVELLHGYPGSPWTWLHAMNVRQHLQDAVAAGGTPYVLVIPAISVPGAPDLECTDLPHQPQVATFLTQQVPKIVTSRFRVRSDAQGWSMLGYSEGGYCAAQLVMRNPATYSAAVSIAGYDHPLSPYFANLPAYTKAGSFSTLLATRPAVAILATESAQDPQASGTLQALRQHAKPPTATDTVLHPTGGHNPGAWEAELTTDFLWLSHHTGGITG